MIQRPRGYCSLWHLDGAVHLVGFKIMDKPVLQRAVGLSLDDVAKRGREPKTVPIYLSVSSLDAKIIPNPVLM